MPIEFQGANAVILSRQAFNPALFSQAWMIDRLQIHPSGFKGETIQTPVVFATHTGQFNLFVVSDRIQLNLPANREAGTESEGDMVKRIMHEILAHIPAPSGPGAGMNFNWTVDGSDRPNSETTRRLFFSEETTFFRLFGDSTNACFGAYASRDYKGVRLRVDAKPMHQPNNEQNAKLTIFNFNFNVDFDAPASIEEFDQLFGLWEDAKREAARMMNVIREECGV